MKEQTEAAARRVAGIIGYPLGHSVSPPMHQAAFNYLGIGADYEVWETPSERLRERVAALREPSVLGASVTIPFKEQVIPLLDELDPLARRAGAVNTIANRGGRLAGYNTDVGGFLRALTEDAGFRPRGAAALILGAGGAARAVAVALAQAGAAAVTVTNRTPARAEALVEAVQAAFPHSGCRLGAAPWGAVPAGVQLMVNATSMGMRHGPAEGRSPLEAGQIPSGGLVCDLVYNPADTPLLQAAAKAGARRLGGLPMLVYQGAMAFELWTGRPGPVKVMRQAARRALR